MLLIAIVDDDNKDAQTLKGQVEQFFSEKKEACLIKTYEDGLSFIRSSEEYDIVFLDIRMDKLDGLETARILRKINRDTLLIFVTYMTQFAIKGYEVDAMDFIVKPTDQFSINHVLDKAMKRISSRAGLPLLLKTASGVVTISSRSVYYVEIYNHDLVYHTEEGDFKVRGQLGDVYKKLENHHFILCSRSYLANLRHINSVGSGFLVVHGEKIPISKSHRKEIEERFINYLGESL